MAERYRPLLRGKWRGVKYSLNVFKMKFDCILSAFPVN